MKGNNLSQNRLDLLKKGLIVFQFVISITFLITLSIITGQNNFIFSKSDQELNNNTLVVPFEYSNYSKVLALKENLIRNPSVSNVSFSNFTPSQRKSFYSFELPENGKECKFEVIVGSEEYLKTFNISIKSGRTPQPIVDNSAELLINETAAKMLGWDNPVGKKLPIHNGTVVGVMKDFHYSSLHNSIKPLAISNIPFVRFMFVKLASGQNTGITETIKGLWSKHLSNTSFEYQWLKDDFNKMYSKEITTKKGLDYISVIAAFISLCGLFSITSFMIEKKKKEFSIRKVLGSSSINIVNMINRQFILLVFAANIISWPLAYYLGNAWLQNYAYKIDISWHYFGFGFIISTLLSIFLVSYLSARAASINPVENLKYE